MGVALIVILAVIVLAAIPFLVFNSVVSARNRVDNGWAQIDVQLTRRHDLIPNVVETVKGYAAHEKSTLEAVITARNAATRASGVGEKSDAENVLTASLKSLFALAEAYPDLKANQNFLALQEELSSTENRIAFARQYYNDVVTQYNTRIQTFPGLLVAKFGDFPPREIFSAQAESRSVPEVAF